MKPKPVWSGQRIIYVRTGRTCGRFRSVGRLVWSETLFRSGLGLAEFGFTFAGGKVRHEHMFYEYGSLIPCRRCCYKLKHKKTRILWNQKFLWTRNNPFKFQKRTNYPWKVCPLPWGNAFESWPVASLCTPSNSFVLSQHHHPTQHTASPLRMNYDFIANHTLSRAVSGSGYASTILGWPRQLPFSLFLWLTATWEESLGL